MNPSPVARAACDVVALLDGGPSTYRVAKIALAEALRRDAPIRFVRLQHPGGPPDRALAIALRAMRGAPPVPVAFEVVSVGGGVGGEAGEDAARCGLEALLARCVGAAAVVVADDGVLGADLLDRVAGEVVTVTPADVEAASRLGFAV